MKQVINYGKAICYSGYRQGQSPITKTYPSYDEVKEDLILLDKDFDYIRMYDPLTHAKTACEVITKENLNLKIMLGMDLLGEISNPNCSWGGEYTEEELAKHIKHNQHQLEELIKLANTYEDIVLAVSAGNESVPEWNENLVSTSRVLYFVKELKKHTNVPVTYCDNFHYWKTKLNSVAKAVDVISIHTYPVWTGTSVEIASKQSISEYNLISSLYPDKQVIITETGWTTKSNGGEIKPEVAIEENQYKFNTEMEKFTKEHNIPCFFFEAFDEPWKGSSNPDEPEKHWGYYNVERTPKMIIK